MIFRKIASRALLTVSIAAAIVSVPYAAQAHPLSASFSELKLQPDATEFKFSIDELSVIESTSADADGNGALTEAEVQSARAELDGWIGRHVVLQVDGIAQRGELREVSYGQRGDKMFVALSYAYPAVDAGQTVSIEDGLYRNDGNTSYVNLLTFTHGETTEEHLIKGDNRLWKAVVAEGSVASDAPEGWMQFFVFGMEHILTGYDHLLFLLALLLLRTNFKTYAAIVTSFTVAHSITISLAMFGIVRLPAQWIEIAIALSIVYVAAENLFRKEAKRRWMLTFAFGLIHGLGFANLLIDMTIPPQHLAVSLLSFNLGIEAMQLLLVLAALPALKYVQNTKLYKPAVQLASSLLILVGGYWAIERFLGA
ncbi:HupE/UreJ family protein [Paenibacillus sp.]|uniref:HupE/UreJ family protein n=1 Tax=Paenibacillus sp. TaxID=58172 RepID=UPI002D2D9CBE|nr:HupE/UreJ family protein [Paenibacillus sp.]HZG88319.1 HupE/UreJ family protein [Paenibacillus sp.]